MNVELLGQLGQRFLTLTAARATFALNAAVWFLRGRLLISSPLLSHLRLPKNRTST
jgi:hypothetical protein